MKTLPTSTLNSPIYRLRSYLYRLRIKIPARYILASVLAIIVGAVAFQNVRATSLDTAYKSYDRLGRYFEFSLITEGCETVKNDSSTSNYMSANIDMPALAMSTSDLSSYGLLNEKREIAITDETALADQSIALTKVSERPREEIISYTIQSGDTLSTIAEEFGLSVRTVMWENKIGDSTILKPGAVIYILPVDGLTYTIEAGDTLTDIAKKFQASVDKIISFNNLPSETAIKEGQKLIIPGGVKPAEPKPVTPAPTQVAIASTGTASGFGPMSETTGDTTPTGSFGWPASCNYISQNFGWWHTGLDVACAHGSPLYAADGGVVVSAGWQSGYGYAIDIDHGNGITTKYAHIMEGGMYVQVGQAVSRGQNIAGMGSTGWSTGPHVHFEVRVGGVPQNPLNYL